MGGTMIKPEKKALFFPGALWVGRRKAPDWAKVVNPVLPMWRYGTGEVERVKSKSTYQERRVLLGFSSGANFCLAAAQTFHPKLIVTSGLSGLLPTGIGNHEPCKILILHGENDWFRSEEQIESVRKALDIQGHTVVIQRFPGGHRWPQELNDTFEAMIGG